MWPVQPVASFFAFQDRAKLKVHKRSDPIEPEVINNMVRYARKSVAQFRALKSSKNILYRRSALQTQKPLGRMV